MRKKEFLVIALETCPQVCLFEEMIVFSRCNILFAELFQSVSLKRAESIESVDHTSREVRAIHSFSAELIIDSLKHKLTSFLE